MKSQISLYLMIGNWWSLCHSIRLDETNRKMVKSYFHDRYWRSYYWITLNNHQERKYYLVIGLQRILYHSIRIVETNRMVVILSFYDRYWLSYASTNMLYLILAEIMLILARIAESDLKIRICPQYRKSQLFCNYLFVAPSLPIG